MAPEGVPSGSLQGEPPVRGGSRRGPARPALSVPARQKLTFPREPPDTKRVSKRDGERERERVKGRGIGRADKRLGERKKENERRKAERRGGGTQMERWRGEGGRGGRERQGGKGGSEVSK